MKIEIERKKEVKIERERKKERKKEGLAPHHQIKSIVLQRTFVF